MTWQTPYTVRTTRTCQFGRFYWSERHELLFEDTVVLVSRSRSDADLVARLGNAAYNLGFGSGLVQGRASWNS